MGRRGRIEPVGTVYEVVTATGLAYLQSFDKPGHGGHWLRVLREPEPAALLVDDAMKLADSSEIRMPALVYILAPLQTGDPTVKVVGHADLPAELTGLRQRYRQLAVRQPGDTAPRWAVYPFEYRHVDVEPLPDWMHALPVGEPMSIDRYIAFMGWDAQLAAPQLAKFATRGVPMRELEYEFQTEQQAGRFRSAVERSSVVSVETAAPTVCTDVVLVRFALPNAPEQRLALESRFRSLAERLGGTLVNSGTQFR